MNFLELRQIKYIVFGLVMIIILLIALLYKRKPESLILNKKIYDLNNLRDSIEFQNWVHKNFTSFKLENPCYDHLEINDTPIVYCGYEDEKFRVFDFCMGEFGGSLIFMEKDSPDYLYYLNCTCPLMIDKIKGKYYISETLAHLGGRGTIQVIDDPKNLIKIRKDSLLQSWNSWSDWPNERFKNLTAIERYQKLHEQGEIVIDTSGHSSGMVFNIFFIRNRIKYLIYSDYKSTLLGVVENGQVAPIDTILNVGNWKIGNKLDELNGIRNGIYHYSYATGDIYVKDDTIVVGYSKGLDQ